MKEDVTSATYHGVDEVVGGATLDVVKYCQEQGLDEELGIFSQVMEHSWKKEKGKRGRCLTP